MKKTITIQSIEEKISSNNSPYLSIKAVQGRYSCWEEILFPTLKASINTPIEVEIMQKGKYENIVGAGEMMPTEQASRQYFPKKETGIKQAQDRKAEYIKEAQARKNDSILFFNSFNAAVSLLPHLNTYKNSVLSDQDILELVFKLADEIYSHNENYIK